MKQYSSLKYSVAGEVMRHLVVFAVIFPLLISTTVSGQIIPREKQTTLGLYLTAKQAYERWKMNPEKIFILDVRTPEEYLFVGHPPMAWNVPYLLQTFRWDTLNKRFLMRSNNEFPGRVKQLFQPTDTIFVSCRSGSRSAMAVNLLATAGYKNVYTITDGMEGDLVEDPSSVFRGQYKKNGWKNSGLPFTYDIDPKKMLLPANYN